MQEERREEKIRKEEPYYPLFFDQFPHKRTHAAELLFATIVESGEATEAELVATAEKYAAHHKRAGTPPQFVKTPLGWLRDKCWRDPLPLLPPVRRDAEGGWIVTHGTEQFEAWRSYYSATMQPNEYDFRNEPGLEVRVREQWPPTRRKA